MEIRKIHDNDRIGARGVNVFNDFAFDLKQPRESGGYIRKSHDRHATHLRDERHTGVGHGHAAETRQTATGNPLPDVTCDGGGVPFAGDFTRAEKKVH